MADPRDPTVPLFGETLRTLLEQNHTVTVLRLMISVRLWLSAPLTACQRYSTRPGMVAICLAGAAIITLLPGSCAYSSLGTVAPAGILIHSIASAYHLGLGLVAGIDVHTW